MFNKCDRDEFEIFVRMAQQIWFRRNSVVHEEEFIHPNYLVRGALESSEEYKKANLRETSPPNEISGEI